MTAQDDLTQQAQPSTPNTDFRGTQISGPDKKEDSSPLQELAKKLAQLKQELVQEIPDEKPAEENVMHVNATTPTLPQAETVLPVVESPTPPPPTTPTIPIIESPVINNQPFPPNSTLDQLYPEINATQPKVEDAVVEPAPSTTPSEAPMPQTQVPQAPDIDENDNSQASPSVVEAPKIGGKYPLGIDKIMDIAIERNASDIQISVGYPVMIRIDGTLIAVNEQIVSKDNAEELILPVLSEQKKELLEVNKEVDLAYTPIENPKARFRINAYYSKGTLAAAFRLIPTRIRTIEELQLPSIYNQITRLSQGLVLVTGPTGHGKSTTLAAMVQAVNLNRSVHILTIEDPIEYIFNQSKAVVDQREMHDDTQSWAVALKSALRQDPDVILVGEMRDYETIAATITLAETGHLVFATLHTNSAAQAIDRIIDVFPEFQQQQVRAQLSSIIEAVIAQRLVPIDGGGRRAVSEILLGTPAVRTLIREGKTHQIDNVIRTSIDVGMISLEQSLVKLVREGVITMERAQEYAIHPEEVVRLLKS